MVRQDYIKIPEVKEFVDWAARHLPVIPVVLNVTRKGTGRAGGSAGPGVQGEFEGLDAVVNAYHWRSECEVGGHRYLSGNWGSTRNTLHLLSGWLRDGIDQRDNEVTETACREIIRWGGDRNPNVGALQFLGGREDLSGYLSDTRDKLRLHFTDINILNEVRSMNAMLTKVHALASEDGLPIYDSRVAAAAGSLIELYRRTLVPPWEVLPEALRFKATDRRTRKVNGASVRTLDRQVSGLGGQVIEPGVLRDNPKNICHAWTSSKVRLGWLLEEIIAVAEKEGRPIFENDTLTDDALPARMPEKMHAFEASLFMIGFDVTCLI